MPQLWLTYQELVAEGFAADVATARSKAIQHGMTRKKSRDGLSRVLLFDEFARKVILDLALRELLADLPDDYMASCLRSWKHGGHSYA